MAEETENNEDAEQVQENPTPEPGGKKKNLLLGGGIAGVLAAGAIAAMMAVPSTDAKPRFKGPFTIPLFEDKFNCNLIEQEHYLQMKPEVIYQVYDANYLKQRILDQLYLPEMKNAVLRVATNKSMQDLFGEADYDAFAEELSVALDPVLFPAHIGSSKLPWDPDGDSGLRPGLSADTSTFRGGFHDHVLHVDGDKLTLQIDEGPVTEFSAGDPDVRVIDANGSVLFVDVSGLSEDFTGDVQIGVRGRILRILPLEMMIQ